MFTLDLLWTSFIVVSSTAMFTYWGRAVYRLLRSEKPDRPDINTCTQPSQHPAQRENQAGLGYCGVPEFSA